MIRDFSVKLKPSNGYARIAFVVSMSCSFALVLLSGIVPLYRGLVSLAGTVLLVTALAVYSKYMLPTYYYDIMVDSDGLPLFVVRQQIKRKSSTLCRISLAEVVEIEREEKSDRRLHKTPKGFVKYSYLPTLMPNVTHRITVVNDYESAEIRIEASDEFATFLKRCCEEAKMMNGKYE